jgi:RNA polymerase sigma-70 factor, ECF subfamily
LAQDAASPIEAWLLREDHAPSESSYLDFDSHFLLSFFPLGDNIDREFSMESPCMDDQNTISRLKQGDLSALETLVKQYQVRAVHAAYAIVYDRALAEDIVQTAFLKVVERVHQFDQERPFAPWFFRIVVNDSIKAARKQKTTLSLDQESDVQSLQLAKLLIDPGSLPELMLEQKQIRENLLRAIQSLSPEQRAVIVMRYLLDMSEADMSTNMDRPLSTVKWWLREARHRLRNLIGTSPMEEDS